MIATKYPSFVILIVSCAIALGAATTNAQTVDPVRVLVWDEQQPEQSRAYGEKFLGETIVGYLESRPGISVRTARLDDADQGLDDSRLEAAEVLVFWCHRRSRELDDKRAEAVVQRVLAGKLGLIALHSAHWAKPFVRLMQERVFYFRPGHETFPIYKQAEPLRVIENAVRWLSGKSSQETADSPHPTQGQP